MQIIDHLKWRYATKKFDPSKKVSAQDLDLLMETIRLSASSYGLQPYKVLLVENQSIREQLKPVSWGQNQITDASNLFVFCNYLDVNEKDVSDYMHLKANAIGVDASKFDGYAQFINGKMREKSLETKKHWTAKQIYIALGNLMMACAELKIDACPLEGFEPEAYDDILKLKDKGLTAAVALAIGYRSEEDQNQFSNKVRKTKDALFEVV